ncbi:MAG: 50S ribosomal protein L6 [Chloroflexi bacterium]|nr:50S ribosomal protein L6 [Chloroflexota bacterium]
MSRVGLKPLPIPQGVDVRLEGGRAHVRGPRGELERALPLEISVSLEDGIIHVSRPSDRRYHRALHGLTRSLLANMVEGVSQGFAKTLALSGVGYRAAMDGGNLVLQVGFSHPVIVAPLSGVKLSVEGPTRIVVSGVDKEMVGEMAARIRHIRPAEPYKGKGISYTGETIRRKVGKAGKVGARK